MKRKVIITFLILLEVIMVNLTYHSFLNRKITNYEDTKVSKKQFAMYINDGNGYTKYEEEKFPNGYSLNNTKSYCEDINGNIVENIISSNGNSITITSSKTVYCTLYFDKIYKPILKVTSGKYDLDSDKLVYEVDFDKYTGNVTCINKSFNNSMVTTYKSVGFMGSNEIECTATNEYGLSTVVKGTLIMEKTFLGKELNSVNGTYDGNSLNIPIGGEQYGPYWGLQPGCYKIIYSGIDFPTSSNNYIASYYPSESVMEEIPIYEFEATSNEISYIINSNKVMTGFEMHLYKLNNPIRIDSVKIEPLDSCDNFDEVKNPELKVISGKHDMNSDELIYEANFGKYNGSVICKNKSNNDEEVTTFRSINILGNNEIECTATNKYGLSTTVKETITLERAYLGKEMLSVDGEIIDNSLYIPSGGGQYGPYISLQPGCYLITYVGEDLDVGDENIGATEFNESGEIVILPNYKINYSSNEIIYKINADHRVINFETRIAVYNRTIRIDTFKINYLASEC